MNKTYYLYILAIAKHGPTYVGVTNDLHRRLEEHRFGKGSKHVAKHNIWRLVYFEHHEDIDFAITREKRIKRWRVAWKHELIESQNPNWENLTISGLDMW